MSYPNPMRTPRLTCLRPKVIQWTVDPNHSGSIWVNWICLTNPVGRLGTGWLVHACSRCSPSKGGSIIQSPPNSGDICFKITYRLILSWRWSNARWSNATLVATLESSLSLSLRRQTFVRRRPSWAARACVCSHKELWIVYAFSLLGWRCLSLLGWDNSCGPFHPLAASFAFKASGNE